MCVECAFYSLRGILLPLFSEASTGYSQSAMFKLEYKSKQRTNILTKWGTNQGPRCSLDLSVDPLSFLKYTKIIAYLTVLKQIDDLTMAVCIWWGRALVMLLSLLWVNIYVYTTDKYPNSIMHLIPRPSQRLLTVCKKKDYKAYCKWSNTALMGYSI